MDGFETKSEVHLPAVFSTLDKDILHSVDKNGRLLFLINKIIDEQFFPALLSEVDIHIMNKASITRNSESLLELT
jgi:hypothetical protein